MLHKIRSRAEGEQGFTLIELLVVILIIGILAAIAIPSFLNQKSKANDSAAKTQVHAMKNAMETFATDHNGDYSTATLAQLQTLEPTLNDVSQATPSAPSNLSSTGYTVTSTAASTKDTFSITMNNGAQTRTCVAANANNTGGCTNGTW